MITPLALKAQQVIEAAWRTGPAQHLGTQAAEALESAQMLMCPEIAAELERLQAETAELRKRVADLEAERHSTNEALADLTVGYRAERDALLAAQDGIPVQRAHMGGHRA